MLWCQMRWGEGEVYSSAEGRVRETFPFESALRVGFRPSGDHIWTHETEGSYLDYTSMIDHLTFYKAVLKTNRKCKSAPI